jgi:Holliday junction resolvase
MEHGKVTVEITKASGEKSLFSPEKLLGSLLKSGAERQQADQIVDTITKELYPGVSTRKIYRKAFNLLKNSSRHLAARYNLKNAIMQLGPSGYPFERYIGEILKCQGYRVQVGQIVTGHCVNHEIDVIAEKGRHHFMIECKYHNQQGTISDVKIPLYIQSRFKDVEAHWKKLPGHSMKFHQGWVVTNTRFTEDAISYGTCSGLKLLGWDYPSKGSLKQTIDELGLYPVTCLTSLTIREKKALLQKNIVLCAEVYNDTTLLSSIDVSPARIATVLKESKELCGRIMVVNQINSPYQLNSLTAPKHKRIPSR